MKSISLPINDLYKFTNVATTLDLPVPAAAYTLSFIFNQLIIMEFNHTIVVLTDNAMYIALQCEEYIMLPILYSFCLGIAIAIQYACCSIVQLLYRKKMNAASSKM